MSILVICSHPAHISLPTSRSEGSNRHPPLVLHRLVIGTSSAVPPPFSQDGCHKLLMHLNDPSPTPTVTVHTRVIGLPVSSLHWRQMHFRPYKPLHHDVPIMQRPRRHIPVGRMFVDTSLAFCAWASHSSLWTGQLTAGIQYWRFHLVGACACLAAVIFSASVTLMTLPGLNGIARIAGLVAIMIVCLVLSMITSFIAIVRYKV
ncbi:hypothetical protein M405DRAFT_120311 [Rhizopogon salebrosus TDB-379]|nr:hypothetical protein M405DRAFT_120311 [Rhizopogon salebrosus TDB-379]